jgi:hypothetical protein
MFKILPDIKRVFDQFPILHTYWIRFAADKITAIVFLESVKQALMRYYGVPKEMLSGEFIVADHQDDIQEDEKEQ